MRVLLDTHAFLWWISGSPKLSEAARETIADERNDLLFSVVSGWEISIKVGVGKLDLPETPRDFVTGQVLLNDLRVLTVSLDHALRVYDLPNHHRDPFDRLIVAQALSEGVPVLTADPLVARYSVETIW
ncbi:MAG: type II toxin-antitoxin system VapC family toxin [Rubrobacter sp.]|nr:type II toxin-antitoxin system VapC family toxin [Rubrobacter sp.]